MILAAALLLGACLGWLSGGRVHNLANVDIIYGGTMILIFVAQSLLRGPYFAFAWLPGAIRVWLWCGLTLVLLVLVFVNRRLPGFWVLGVGFSLNLLVIALNGGMPLARRAALAAGAGADALPSSLGPGFYRLATPGTRLAFLADAIPVRLPGLASGVVFSVGDLLMLLGVVIFVARGMHTADDRD